MRLFIIIIIGLSSLVFTLSKIQTDHIFIKNGEVKTAAYNIDFYNNSGKLILSVSPLNDYYYDGFAKDHLLTKIKASDKGSLFQQISLTIKGLLFGEKQLIWRASGNNSKGNITVNYSIEDKSDRIEITRKVQFVKTVATGIGQAVIFCPDCLISDNMHRVYFNGNSFNGEKMNLALKLNLLPFVLGENQFFPAGISKIIVLDSRGKTQIEIPVSPRDQIFLQDKWHLLEVKSVIKDTESVLKQNLYFPS
ncbi:MAG: hypothetical protein M1268_00940 [Patescibacteria group bacterium]|nr:hypothetical protein [Actinomycetota bacterium]MCL5438538.1 hypothetical protein [Patescibacteria group bacterium]